MLTRPGALLTIHTRTPHVTESILVLTGLFDGSKITRTYFVTVECGVLAKTIKKLIMRVKYSHLALLESYRNGYGTQKGLASGECNSVDV